MLELWVAWSVTQSTSCCLTSQLQLCPPRSTVCHHARSTSCSLAQSRQAARLPLSSPPTSLGECFFFISLVVGLPYSSIFCQFWLVFVLKLLNFFWLCKEAQCVYLHLHLGRKLHFVFLCTTCLFLLGKGTPWVWLVLSKYWLNNECVDKWCRLIIHTLHHLLQWLGCSELLRRERSFYREGKSTVFGRNKRTRKSHTHS